MAKVTQYVWEASWQNGETEPRVQLISSIDLRRARVKAEKYQEQAQFDGDLVSIVRRKDIVL